MRASCLGGGASQTLPAWRAGMRAAGTHILCACGLGGVARGERRAGGLGWVRSRRMGSQGRATTWTTGGGEIMHPPPAHAEALCHARGSMLHNLHGWGCLGPRRGWDGSAAWRTFSRSGFPSASTNLEYSTSHTPPLEWLITVPVAQALLNPSSSERTSTFSPGAKVPWDGALREDFDMRHEIQRREKNAHRLEPQETIDCWPERVSAQPSRVRHREPRQRASARWPEAARRAPVERPWTSQTLIFG
jgi:hypothetical protein